MGTLNEDLLEIKEVEDTLVANKVARFAYTDTAYEDNDADGVDDYDFGNEQNIPNPTTAVLKVNSTVLDKGYRAQASSITRMLINHFFGRVSYNLNKINDNMSALIATLRSHTGTANGFATLDSNGRIPYSQLPESAIELKGYWDADTNTPELADGTGTNGDEYIVSVAGTQNLGSGSQYFGVGDRVLYASGVWKNISSGFVRTINGEAPNAQGEGSVILGKSNFPITKDFIATLFSKLLLEYVKKGDGTNATYSMACVSHSNNIWVSGSEVHGLWWSTDGKNWTKGTNAPDITFAFIEYHDDIWVAGSVLGAGGVNAQGVWWSEDGKNWTQGSGGIPNSKSVRSIVYQDGIWVCGVSSGSVWWSEDGKNWTQGTNLSSNLDVYEIVYIEELWLCSSTSGIWWSEDGKSWTQGSGVTASMYSIVYAENIYVCGSNSGMWWSVDGKSWTQGTGGNTSYTSYSCVYSEGLWVASSSSSHGMWWSEDGKSWTQGSGVTDCSVNSGIRIVCKNGTWLVYTSSSSLSGLLCSVNGKSWSYIANPTPKNYALFYTNGIWVNSWSYSEKGYEDWNSIKSITSATYIRDIARNNGMFVFATSSGMYYSSVDDLITDDVIDFGENIPLVNVRELS